MASPTTAADSQPASSSCQSGSGRPNSHTQPWVHLAAGASGGVVTSILTAPLDVLRTRLQSDFYPTSKQRPVSVSVARASFKQLFGAPFHHTLETFAILGTIKASEGWHALFRGLGPSLVGAVPSAGVKFYVYGNCKRLGAAVLGRSEEDSLVHAQAAVLAVVAAATITNPIWLVKTRLQLDTSQTKGGIPPQYRGSLDCIAKVVRKEGLGGLYKGVTASYLGAVETAIQLMLYEQLKAGIRTSLRSDDQRHPLLDELAHWATTTGAAGTAKFAAVLATYPHEVVRTRLRQAPMADGRPRYLGVAQCFRSVWANEGRRGLYGGLTPHLVRSVPSAIITLGVYEFVLRLAGPYYRPN